jgi:hypothetical protein
MISEVSVYRNIMRMRKDGDTISEDPPGHEQSRFEYDMKLYISQSGQKTWDEDELRDATYIVNLWIGYIEDSALLIDIINKYQIALIEKKTDGNVQSLDHTETVNVYGQSLDYKDIVNDYSHCLPLKNIPDPEYKLKHVVEFVYHKIEIFKHKPDLNVEEMINVCKILMKVVAVRLVLETVNDKKNMNAVIAILFKNFEELPE